MGPARPAPLPTAADFPGEDPFGSIDIDDATVTDIRTAAAPAPLPPPAGEDPFGSIDVDDATVTAVHAPPPVEDPFASLDLGGPAPAARGASSAPAQTSPKDLFDLSSDLDVFGEQAGVQPTDTGRAALLGASSPSMDSLDDLGAPQASGISLLGEVPPAVEAGEFSVTLGKVGAPAGSVEVLDVAALPSRPSVSVARPTARPEDVGIPQSRPLSRARKATALLVNLVVAAVLVVVCFALGSVYLSEGRVDLSVLSPDRLRDFILPAPKPFVALDVTNALYDTKSGRPLFFVRGEAENRSASATRIRVRAALYDGKQRVRSAEALAGTLPTPEELYAVGSADAATALSQRLDAAATPVAPGAKAPFFIMFQEYPADLGSFRLEVTLEPVPTAKPEAGSRTE